MHGHFLLMPQHLAAFSAFIAASVSLVFSVYFYTKSASDRDVPKSFPFLLLVTALWLFFYHIWLLATDQSMALLWIKIAMTFAIFTYPPLVHFVTVFSGQKHGKNIVWFSYITAGTIALINLFTSLFISGVEERGGIRYWPIPGSSLFLVYTVIWVIVVAYSLASLLRYRAKEVDIIKKKKAVYYFAGLTISFVGGATNFFLWYNINIGPWGNYLIPAYAAVLSYGIVRNKFASRADSANEIFAVLLIAISSLQFMLARTVFEFIFYVIYLCIITIFSLRFVRTIKVLVAERKITEGLNTKLERAVKDLETTNEKLKLLDKAKDEFLSIASHQLRTPLTAIKGYVSMIVDGDYGKVPAQVKEKLQNVYTANERLVKLVDDLLNISRIEAGRMQLNTVPVQLNDIITEAMNELQFKSKEKNISIEFTPVSDLALVMADKDKIFEVVMNLVDNAIKYSEKGSVRVSALRQHGMVLCAVKDDGMGMTDETIGQLFQKFSRGGMRNVVGNGLGLYIGRLIIEAHGGRIWVESQGPGKGSQFYFVLPVAPGQPET